MKMLTQPLAPRSHRKYSRRDVGVELLPPRLRLSQSPKKLRQVLDGAYQPAPAGTALCAASPNTACSSGDCTLPSAMSARYWPSFGPILKP